MDLKTDLVKVLQSLLKPNKYKSNTNTHVKFNTQILSATLLHLFFFFFKSESRTHEEYILPCFAGLLHK